MKKLFFLIFSLISITVKSQDFGVVDGKRYDPFWIQRTVTYESFFNDEAMGSDTISIYEIMRLEPCEQIHAVRTFLTDSVEGCCGMTSAYFDILIYIIDSDQTISLTPSGRWPTTIEPSGPMPPSIAFGCWSGSSGVTLLSVAYTHDAGISKLTAGEIKVWVLVSKLPDCP